MKPNLPGLPTISALMLTVVLTVWLGLWGPTDISKLQEWQTLIAGFMALIAAGIAYWGATAKVRYDREVLAAENMRRKLTLYLKLEVAFRELIDAARHRGVRFMFASVGTTEVFTAKDFAIEEPPELEEAWAYLDVFPRQVIAEIQKVRTLLRKLAAMKVGLGEATIEARHDKDRPFILSEANSLLTDMWHSAALVIDELRPLIRELAPEMDESERMIRIYGEPGPEDFVEEE